jgi:hypothetical protein
MIGLGALIGLPDRVDHPREPPTDSPRSAGQSHVPARRGLRLFSLHSSYSFENNQMRLAPVVEMVVAAQSDKRDFFSVS